jgi:hypothetical protein
MPIGIMRDEDAGGGGGDNLPLAEGYGHGDDSYIINLHELEVPVESYYSNYGFTGSGADGEGHWIDVYRNGQYQVAGLDFFESPVNGTGATYFSFSELIPPPSAEEVIAVIVYKL